MNKTIRDYLDKGDRESAIIALGIYGYKTVNERSLDPDPVFEAIDKEISGVETKIGDLSEYLNLLGDFRDLMFAELIEYIRTS